VGVRFAARGSGPAHGLLQRRHQFHQPARGRWLPSLRDPAVFLLGFDDFAQWCFQRLLVTEVVHRYRVTEDG
jgi:hypothetical protein